MRLFWVLLCGAVLGVVETTVAPAAPASSGHATVALTVSPGVGTHTVVPVPAAATPPGGLCAQPCPEEPPVNFTLRLLDGDLGATKRPLVLSRGAVLRLEARVDASPDVSPRISVEQCYGTGSGQRAHPWKSYMVVNSHGCLHGSGLGSVSVQQQRGMSVLQLSILAPVLEAEPEEEVYVHCLLSAWGARRHGPMSCFYNDTAARWHNAEDPSRSALCDCCDTQCPPADTGLGEQPGTSLGAVLGGEGCSHRGAAGCASPQASLEKGCSTGRQRAHCWCGSWSRGSKVSRQPRASPRDPKPTNCMAAGLPVPQTPLTVVSRSAVPHGEEAAAGWAGPGGQCCGGGHHRGQRAGVGPGCVAAAGGTAWPAAPEEAVSLPG
eukprot:XP_025011443.1 uncharacterized protein LOC101751481 [Gallus gallus]